MNENTIEMMQDARGRWVPLSMVKPVDLLRDQTVKSILERVTAEAEVLKELKKQIYQDIQSFLEISASEHGAKFGGNKGNITLKTYDGQYKLVVAISDKLVFNEKLQVAKSLIDQCISRWSEGSKPEIVVLVNDAFNVDKAGNLSTTRILGLRRADIQDEQWQEAMKAITESITVAFSKTYLRFYRLKENGEYEPISLDISSL